MLDNYFIFTNATVLKVQGEEDGIMNLFLKVVILGVVTAVLLTIILILVLKNQDPNALNYAALNFTSKIKKRERRREELDPHVVYAATR
ncbi:unnamed protein product [Coregonus sp. 'balchen']|nr:unnamed protein product [Coregonus sp. 'balchen']